MIVIVLGWIVAGLAAGWIGHLIAADTSLGVVGDLLMGILGGVIGGIVTTALGTTGLPQIEGFDPSSILVAFVGAAALLTLLHLIGVGTRTPTGA